MSGRTKCPECGSEEVEEDEHYTQSQLVCTQCGCVLSEGLLTTTRSEESFLQEVKYYKSTAELKTPCRNQIHGLNRVRDVCRVLRLRPALEETARGLYRSAYENRGLLHAGLAKKEALAGCCVYISCRQHSWPLTLGTVCSLLQCEPGLVSGLYLHLLELLRIDVPGLALGDLVTTHCQGFRLFQAGVSESAALAEDGDRVTERAGQLVELASETWLATGRHPVPILTAAAYLSWQSLAPSRRLRYSLAGFCRLCGVPLPGPARLRLRELCQVLVRLASRLPWFRGRPDKPELKTVARYLGDVLRHRHQLLRRSLANGGGEGGVGEKEDAEEGEKEREGEEEEEEGERSGFLPPCLTQPKRTRRRRRGGGSSERESVNEAEEGGGGERPPSLCVTGDEEISDTEIELYLRTPREVESYSQASARFL